jgi:hypothetical protein
MKLIVLLLIGIICSTLGFERSCCKHSIRKNKVLHGYSADGNDSDLPKSSYHRTKSFLAKTKTASIISLIGLLATDVLPVKAFGELEDANNKLTSYGLPPIIFLPPGFSPVVSEFGRGNIKEVMTNPLLVQFASPRLWVVATTNVNNNGEAGTISANGTKS